jgi:multidrug resistance efflux pump
MRGKWMLFGGIAVFLAVGAGAITWWSGQLTTNQPKQQPAPPAANPGTANELSLSGRIQPQELIPVAAPVEGVIDELFVEPGGEVYEGQLLARIRNGKLESALESATAEAEKLKTRMTTLEGSIIAARLESSRAEAEAARVKSEYDLADRAFQRQQMLLREGATPRLTYEKAERDFKQIKIEYDSAADVARIATDRVVTLNRDLDAAKKLYENKAEDLENAKEEAGHGELKSPVDGIVVSRKGSPGEQVSRLNEDFFVLAANLNALQVAADIDPAAMQKVKAGQTASIRVAESADEIPGVVREIRNGQVLVDFTNPDASIKPGLSAQVRIFLLSPTPTPPPPATEAKQGK